MSEWLVRDTERDTERPVDSRSEAEEVADDLRGIVKQSGGDPESIEIVPPGSVQENPPHDNHGDPIETGTDGGTQIVDHAEDESPTEGNEQPQTAPTPDTSVTTLPDRDITDDPIEWLNREAGDFVDNIKGTDAINKKGFRVLQHFYDISTTSEVIVGPEETDFEYCRVKSVATMPDGQKAEAHGSAHVRRDDDPELLLEMADTRAKSRALSDITGVGAVAVAEMKGSKEL